MVKFILRLNNIFFNDLICFLLYSIFQSTNCNVDIFDYILTFDVINQNLIFGLEEQECRVKLF